MSTVDFYAKTFPILYPCLENSITGNAIIHILRKDYANTPSERSTTNINFLIFFFFQVIEKFREQGANSLAELWAVSDGLRSSITELSFKEAVLRLTQRQYRRPFLTLNFLFVLTAFTGNFAIKMAHGTFQSFERMVLLYIGEK